MRILFLQIIVFVAGMMSGINIDHLIETAADYQYSWTNVFIYIAAAMFAVQQAHTKTPL